MNPIIQEIEKTIFSLKDGRKYIFIIPFNPKKTNREIFVKEITNSLSSLKRFISFFILLPGINNIKIIEFNPTPFEIIKPKEIYVPISKEKMNEIADLVIEKIKDNLSFSFVEKNIHEYDNDF